MLSVPGTVPDAVGVNVMLIVQAEPYGRRPFTGQLFVCAKSVLAVILLMTSGAPAVFEKVTICGALFTPG